METKDVFNMSGGIILPMPIISGSMTSTPPDISPDVLDPARYAAAFLKIMDWLEAAQGIWDAVTGWISGFLAAWCDIADGEDAIATAS